MEIFLEPVLPAPRVVVVGETPVATALARLGAEVGLDVRRDGEPDLAVVVASHGRDEVAPLRAALEAGVPYVGLVASRRRGAAVVEQLAGTPRLEALDTPAGLDIGARTPQEIALSILARIVAVRRSGAHAVPAAAAAAPSTAASPLTVVPPEAHDPVCGMTVVVTAATPRAEHAGRTVHFCCEGCRATFEQDPDRFASAL